jgi:putative tricarboxylic transport membrane protein
MFRLYAKPNRSTSAGSNVRLRGSQQGTRVRDGIRDVASHKWLTFRSAVLGTVLGIIPGVGGVAANFVSYGQAAKISRHPEKFGTGIPEGIIAPESSSISKEAGNLLPTVALGVPGGVGMAVLMSGFSILGMVPGPQMLTDHQDAVWAMAFAIGVASLLASLLGLGMAPGLARLARVPSRTLIPFVLTLGFLGVYAATEEISQTIAVFAFGIVGWAMVRYGYSVPAAMIGFLLGKVVEDNLYLVRNLQGWASLERPLTAIMVLIILLSLFSPLFKKIRFRGGRSARQAGRAEAVAAGDEATAGDDAGTADDDTAAATAAAPATAAAAATDGAPSPSTPADDRSPSLEKGSPQ